MHYVTIFVYFLVLLFIGALAARRVKNLGDYYVGGKRLGYWVVVFSARASGESAWLYLGLTGLGAFVGLRALWVVVGECLGVGIAWFCMATPFKQATDRFGSITVPDYLVSRFGDTTRSGRAAVWLRVISAGLLTVFVTIYVSAQIDATGTAFENFLDWNYYVGAATGFVIVVAYTSWGGFVAVAWSDLLQGLLMLVGLAVLPVVAVFSMPPETDLLEELAGMGEGLISLWGPGGASLSNVLIIVSYLAIGLGFLGSPQVFVRFMSIRDVSQIRAGRWIAIAFTVITDTGAVLAGLFGRYLVVGTDSDPDAIFGAGTVLGPSGQNVLPLMVDQLFPSIVVGFYIAAVLAATMSTIDSLLVVASSSLTRDVYQKILKPDVSDERLFRLSRRVTVGLAAVALCLSLTVALAVPGRTIFWFVIFGWSGIAATFCPVIILSLFWKGYNACGALASMVTGFLCVPLFKFVLPILPEWGPYVVELEELAPSFLLSLLAGVLATKLSQRREALRKYNRLVEK